MSAHPIVHIEIPADDQAKSAEFYSNLFGWKTQHAAELNYTMFDGAPGPGGGFPVIDNQNVRRGSVLIHVATDDIESSLKKAIDLGGSVVVPKSEIPGVGWFAVFADPSGTSIGLYTDKNG